MHNKVIFVAWYNGPDSRNEGIARLLNAETYYIGKRMRNKIFSFLSYFSKTFSTFRLYYLKKPDVIIIVNNIWILPFITLLYSLLSKKKVILDTHSDPFTNSYSFITYPRILHKCFVKISLLSIVTNQQHEKIVKKWGGNAIVFPDPPLDLEDIITSSSMLSDIKIDRSSLNIVYVCTFSFDEPFLLAIQAFSRLPKIKFFITGNYKNIKLTKYDNIVYTNYLPRADYISLITHCDALITLTNRENTMQCAGNEALSLGKPLIISKTKFLQEYFKSSAVYVESNVESIVDGVNTLIKNLSIYKVYIRKLKDIKMKESLKIAESINGFINSKVT